MITSIPCVILAGGRSSRMGEDKALLPFKGFDSLIEYQYDKLCKIFKDVYISSKNNKFDFKNINIEDKLIYDKGEIYSPMIALKSIIESLENQKIFIITVDNPFIEINTISEIITKSNSYEVVIAKDENRSHNLCGVFSKSLLNNIDNCLNKGIHKINYLLRNSNTKELLFKDEQQFLNLNTPDDYKLGLSKK